MDWGKARAAMESGQADVIDTIFATEERRKIYDFSLPYATIDVPIYFHQSIGGITDAASLRGFMVGVKEGDACIDHLLAHGVTQSQALRELRGRGQGRDRAGDPRALHRQASRRLLLQSRGRGRASSVIRNPSIPAHSTGR